MTDVPTLDVSSGSASADPEGAAVGTPAPLSRRAALGAEKSKKRTGRLLRRILSGLFVAIALVVLWPAQYGGITGLTVVHGESMEPVYYTGDLVVSVKFPTYAIGDVISYTVPTGQDGAGGRVIHRIVSIDESSGSPILTTLGDNNLGHTDPWVIGPQDVMGKALFSVPGVGDLIGGVSNPLLIGLICGVLVTVVLWSSDSKEDKQRKKAAKAEKAAARAKTDVGA